MSQAYAAARAGRDAALPPLAVDLADFAVWQARDLAGPKLEQLLAVWKARLADLPVPALPTDFVRPAAQSLHGRGRDGAAVAGVRGGAAGDRLAGTGPRPSSPSSPSSRCCCRRLSGATDIAIGTPVAGRTLPELQPIIGFFANMVVLRADLSGEPTTEELLARIRDRVLDALEHQEMPFEKLVEALGAPRDRRAIRCSRSPSPCASRMPNDLRLAGAQVRRADTGIEHAKFDLTVTV